ncbi:ATP-binding protein [Kwoniella heveanensis BCC8398]|uniref:ATP-binding protein n=1 Tax=Kwoniella heveanensis BCC8398 TaxID=1296120 RepID=A0A1B9GVT1_9TREE|nr:ATP-binding protein [Kwoniella heveanensis BCC8398]
MASSTSAPGPSRLAQTHQPPPAPSTSGDSELTVPNALPAEKGIDVSVLKELAKSELIGSLNDIQGAKTLILDPALAGPLGLVTEVALLKHQAVDKMFWLEPGALNINTRNVVWLCRPKMEFMRIIADQIRSQQNNPSAAGPLVYTILLVPRATELCRKVLEDQGVMGDVTISEFKLEFIPMEEDLLSLEMEGVARDIHLNGDDTPIYYSSLALMTFQRAFGLFPRVLGKGDSAKKLADLLQRHHTSGGSQYGDIELSDQVDGLIILDRSVDWATPMCTQLTYEGMLDEFVGIKNSHIEIDAALIDANVSAPPAPSPSGAGLPSTPITKKKKHHLTSSKDRLFGDIRDSNFAVVGSKLSKVARRLEGDYGGVKNLKSVSQMKEFVGKLGGLQSEQQSLRLHTGLTELLMPITKLETFNRNLEAQQNLVAGYDPTSQLNTIEDLLNQEVDWQTVMRTAILMSLTSGGIKPKPLESFKRDFLQTYGYHHLPLLIALQDLGLLVKSPPPMNLPFSNLRRGLRLIVDDIDDSNPNDISYVYSGYAPISIRLVQCLTQKNAILSPAPTSGTGAAGEEDGVGGRGKSSGSRSEKPRAYPLSGWKGFEDVLSVLGGATVDIRQRASTGTGVGSSVVPEDNRTITTVVFFLGGCTYTEIAALRWMSRVAKGRKFLVATTGIINGNNLIESFGDDPPIALIH